MCLGGGGHHLLGWLADHSVVLQQGKLRQSIQNQILDGLETSLQNNRMVSKPTKQMMSSLDQAPSQKPSHSNRIQSANSFVQTIESNRKRELHRSKDKESARPNFMFSPMHQGKQNSILSSQRIDTRAESSFHKGVPGDKSSAIFSNTNKKTQSMLKNYFSGHKGANTRNSEINKSDNQSPIGGKKDPFTNSNRIKGSQFESEGY